MSKTRFTASNEWYIQDGVIYTPLGFRWGDMTGGQCEAAFEYGAHQAQAERDAALGRWRSVEHPGAVGYPRGSNDNGDHALLVDETTGDNVFIRRTLDGIVWAGGIGFWREIAGEYFTAHPVPEPKPWEDAASGELWSLMTADGDAVYLAILADDYGMEFVGLKDRFSADHTGITAGRRIWPEVSA